MTNEQAILEPTISLSPLRKDLIVVPQEQGSSKKYIVKDPLTQKVFGFPEMAIKILEKLDGYTPISDLVIKLTGKQDPDPKVVQSITALVAQAQKAGLLEGTQAEQDTDTEDHETVMGRDRRFNPFFIRLGRLNTEWLMKWTGPIARPLFSKISLAVLLISFGFAANLIARSWPQFLATFEVFGYFKSWLIVYALLTVTTAFHEMGHLLACHRFGGKIHEFGFILYLFQPGAYANISDTWLFPNKFHRIVVALGGVYVESFFFVLGIVVWHYSPPFTQVNQIAFVLALVTITRILFNLLPFLRFDGYWVLSDLLEINNLRPKAFSYLLSIIPIIGRPWRSRKQARSKERRIFLLYGLVSTLFILLAIGNSIFALWEFLAHKFPSHHQLIFWIAIGVIAPMAMLSISRYVRGLSSLQKQQWGPSNG